MTKKSANRLARDKIKKDLHDNQCWDDLNNMYTNMLQLISQHANISTLAQRKDIIACVENKETLIMNIRALSNDLRTMNEDLVKIKALHEGKTGGSQDPDEVFSSINIFEHYRLFMERHDAVIMPTALHIIEQFDQAERKLHNLINEADLKDPDVISDAVMVSETPVDSIAETKHAGDATQVQEVLYTPGINTSSQGIPLVHESVTKPDFDKLMKSFKEINGLAPSA